MITPQDIITKWNTIGIETHPLSSMKIDSFGLSSQTSDFLKQCGLPRQSPPFLSFVGNSAREFDNINSLSFLYDLSNEYDHYINIGGDGAGNPIVINTQNKDAIQLLDHEEDFALLTSMNTNIFTLSLCLIAYKTFVNTVIDMNGPEAFLDANFTDQQFNNLKNDLLTIDKEYAEKGFWEMELKMLLGNRDYYKNESK
ncbi:MAG: hypothetical protein CFE21_09360 [Bacteroidetes bacterium B1(2017)]|nr:MAG: hypothetical protein CFE21_09360 [Bacteroidetes bacterium B1(2017)]